MKVGRGINISVSKCTGGTYFHTFQAISIITVIITPEGV